MAREDGNKILPFERKENTDAEGEDNKNVGQVGMVKLQNLVDQTVLGDTLHSEHQSENFTCTDKACGGALLDPKEGQETITLHQRIDDARDFINQYYESIKRSGTEEHRARLEEVVRCMQQEGVYTHTLEELEYGTKTAWRNAPRCIGRIQWKNLKLFDARHVKTASDMFECMLEHLEYASNGGNIRSAITLFPPSRGEGKDFRVWNSQLVQYAGYRRGQEVIGDPANVALTQVVQSLGWKGKGGQFDVLPMLLQANGNDPEWFDIPPELVLEVQLRHPNFPWFKELGLKWYGVPAVANMRLDCGGMSYTGCPFNGWYMGTEVGARDLCDVQRYNILPIVAEKMGLDVERPATLWKDRAMVEVNVAVLHSYQSDRVTMTDHHTASESFMQHFATETASRGGCPADWVWIVPPLSGSACPVFHQEMIKYHLKPSYEYQEKPWVLDRFGRACVRRRDNPNIHLKLSLYTLSKCITALLSLRQSESRRRPRVTILYATETGRSLVFSRQVARTLQKSGCVPKIVNMADYDVSKLASERHLLIVASTFGSGDPPQNGQNFWKAALAQKASVRLKNLRYSVLALGSTLYERFCQFGWDLDEYLAHRGATRICPLVEADEMKGQESAYKQWMHGVMQFYSEGDAHHQVMSESNRQFRCTFLEGKEMTPSNRVLESLHHTKVKLVKITKQQEIQARGKTPRYFDVQMTADDVVVNSQYEPGDHLQVYPGNRRKDVQMVLSKLQVSADRYTTPLLLEFYDPDTRAWCGDERFPGPVCLHQVLTWFLDLMAPANDEFLEALGLRKPTSNGFIKQNGHIDSFIPAESPAFYLEVLQRAQPQSIPPELLLRHLPTTKPRKYSISTAPLYENNKPDLHVTFKEIVYSRNSVQYKGLCTGFMTGIPTGHRIHISLCAAKPFRLSLAGSKPVLMVAQGTGIAPFRSFWRHKMAIQQGARHYGNSIGPLYLYYGCRNSDIDFLYKKEILSMQSHGMLKDVKMAYSRDKSMPKTYVQELLLKNADQVGRLIYEDKGFIFYCGDIKNWDQICSILISVVQQHADVSYEVASRYLQEMKNDGRLAKDIFMD